MRRFTILSGSCLLTLLVLVAAFLTGQDPRRSKLYRLMHGEGGIAIRRVDLGAGPRGAGGAAKGRAATLTSPAAISFLRSALRDSKEVYIPRSRKYGLRYGTIRFDGGGDEVVALYVPDDEDFLVVGFPVDRLDDVAYYEVALKGPLPDDLRTALRARAK